MSSSNASSSCAPLTRLLGRLLVAAARCPLEAEGPGPTPRRRPRLSSAPPAATAVPPARARIATSRPPTTWATYPRRDHRNRLDRRTARRALPPGANALAPRSSRAAHRHTARPPPAYHSRAVSSRPAGHIRRRSARAGRPHRALPARHWQHRSPRGPATSATRPPPTTATTRARPPPTAGRGGSSQAPSAPGQGGCHTPSDIFSEISHRKRGGALRGGARAQGHALNRARFRSGGFLAKR